MGKMDILRTYGPVLTDIDEQNQESLLSGCSTIIDIDAHHFCCLSFIDSVFMICGLFAP